MFERMVLFGASSDLAARLLMPAVAELCGAGLLPEGFAVEGVARRGWSTDDFQEHVASALATHASHVPHGARNDVVAMLGYRSADATRTDEVRRFTGEDRKNTLFYLALPPTLIEPVLMALSAGRLRSGDAIAIEKPFGTDLASARRLNELIRTRLPEPAVFRIDHFLSSELVRGIVTYRFLNRVFEPTWNAMHVERLDIQWLERLSLEGRATYYDRSGALLDMVQNHLLEVLALVLMEEPGRIDADSVRDARVEALRSVTTPALGDVRGGSLRARYTAGTIDGRHTPSYVDEPGVDPARDTETYASVTLWVNSRRWAGVPFTLRSGKAMAEDTAEIAVHFRPLPRYLRERYPDARPNVLRLGLREPYVRLTTTVNAPDGGVETRELELCSPRMERTPYANLILEMLRGDATLFIRGDEAEEAWRIIDPVVAAWKAGEVPMWNYPAGGRPPGE